MATSFDSIYALNQNIQNNVKLKSYTDNIYYQKLYYWLINSIGFFSSKCYKNLNNKTDFSQELFEFEGDGIQTQFTLTPTPPSNNELYIDVDDNEVSKTEYSYDSVSGVVTFNTPPTGCIYVASYFIGEFSDDLSINEMVILAQAMNIGMVESSLFSDINLDQVAYSDGASFHSQGNHNKATNTIKVDHVKMVKVMINEYTYTDSPNNLKGLSGGTHDV